MMLGGRSVSFPVAWLAQVEGDCLVQVAQVPRSMEFVVGGFEDQMKKLKENQTDEDQPEGSAERFDSKSQFGLLCHLNCSRHWSFAIKIQAYYFLREFEICLCESIDFPPRCHGHDAEE